MSRAGYSDYCGTEWEMICWRGAVASAIKGKRGQEFLTQLRGDLDAMKDKKLCSYDLQTESGEACALGVVGRARGINMVGWDPENWKELSDTLNIAEALVREIEFLNDEEFVHWYDNVKEVVDARQDRIDRKRWTNMRNWVEGQIIQ